MVFARKSEQSRRHTAHLECCVVLLTLRDRRSSIEFAGHDADNDGDQHFLLKLDPGQAALVNKRNQKKKSGSLVLEIVCANPTTMKKAKAACKGYTNRIPIAPVGAHVRATGTYVIDSHNGWAEIHPVSKLEVM